MKTLKKIGIGLLILLVLLILLGIFMSKNVTVKESRVFDVPKNYVFNIVNNLNTYPKWNKWLKDDADINLTFGDIIVGKGASYSWQSKESGAGTMTYDRVVGQDSILATMAFEGMGNSSIFYSLEAVGDKTKLTWEMHSHLGFPYNLMKFFFKYSVSKAYNESLDNIEVLVENRKKGVYENFQITEVIMKEKNYIMNRDEVALSNIQQFYTRNLGAIFQSIQNEGFVMDGKPSGLFFNYDENKGVSDMAAAIPLMESVSMPNLTAYTIPAGPALSIDYYGDYSETGKAHVAMENYMRDRNYLMNPPMVEEYVTDPLKVKEPSKWLTQIRYYYSSTEN